MLTVQFTRRGCAVCADSSPGVLVCVRTAAHETWLCCVCGQFLDWLVAFRSIDEAWAAQPTFLLSEYAYYVLAVLTLSHGEALWV